MTISVNRGLGRHGHDLTVSQLESVSKGSLTLILRRSTRLAKTLQAYYASNMLTVGALAGAKASITLLIVSIRPYRPVRLACYGFLGVVGAWTVAGVVALAFQCDLPKPWVLGPQTCIDQYALQLGLGVVNIITDLAIIVLAFSMMWTVQVSTSRKSTVVALFGLRVTYIPLHRPFFSAYIQANRSQYTALRYLRHRRLPHLLLLLPSRPHLARRRTHHLDSSHAQHIYHHRLYPFNEAVLRRRPVRVNGRHDLRTIRADTLGRQSHATPKRLRDGARQ